MQVEDNSEYTVSRSTGTSAYGRSMSTIKIVDGGGPVESMWDFSRQARVRLPKMSAELPTK